MSDIVRPMQAMDIDRVYELEKTCFRTPWSRDSLAGELKNKIAHYLVLERDGVRYTFELGITPELTQYAVDFADEDGNILFTKHAPYGGTVTLTEDETGARRWDIPDAIYEPLTLEALPADTADDVPDDTDAPEDEPDEEL